VYGLASRLVNTSEQIGGALAPGSGLEVDDAIEGSPRISTVPKNAPLVDHAHGRRALADGRGDAVDRPGPHAAGGKHARADSFRAGAAASHAIARAVKVGQLQVVAVPMQLADIVTEVGVDSGVRLDRRRKESRAERAGRLASR